MGVRWATVSSTTIANAIGGAGETVSIILPPINLCVDNAQIMLFWSLVLGLSAGVTSVQTKIRRGTTVGGTQINLVNNIAAAASTTIALSGIYVDSPGVVAEQQYCCTVTCVGASTASGTNDVCMIAMVL